MGVEHAPEKVWQAQQLYCVERKTFTDVSKTLGVADSTVRRWADRFGWRAERETLAKAQAEIQANTIKGRARVLERLLFADDKSIPQIAFAVAGLERLALQVHEAKNKYLQAELAAHTDTGPEAQAAHVAEMFTAEATTDEERIVLLEQAINQQLSHVLTTPVKNMSSQVREIKAALDVLAHMKGKDEGARQLVIKFMDDEG